MRHPGQIAIIRFPDANLESGKLRPVLLVAELPGNFNDWLVSMISTQLRHEVRGFDEVIREDASDFSGSGLKTASLLRVGRLAVIDGSTLIGAIGEISFERLIRVRNHLAAWLSAKPESG